MGTFDNLKKNLAINKPLLPLKFVLFAYYGGVACLLPYLTIHMRQIGIDVEETAIIYAVLPFTTFMGPPLAGFLADRLGRYQVILIVSLLGSGLFHTALLAVPTTEIQTKPAAVQFRCDQFGSSVSVEKCPGTSECKLYKKAEFINLQLDYCYVQCAAPLLTSEEEIFNADVNTTMLDTCLHRQVSNSDNNSLCITYNVTTSNLEQLNITLDLASKSDDVNACTYRFGGISTGEAKRYTLMTCPSVDTNCTVVCPAFLVAITKRTLHHIPLPAQSSSKWLVPQCQWRVGNAAHTFTCYFITRIFSAVFLSICFSLLDATCFAMMRQHKGDYGKQKLWSVVSTALFSPITGAMIDQLTVAKGITDYSPAFYMFDLFVVITILLTFNMDFTFEKPPDNLILNVGNLMRSAEVNIFLFMIFMMGAFWGFVETFLYWYMLDLGSPKYLLGLTMTVGSGISVPFMFSSKRIVRKIGFVNVLVCAFLFYGLRFVGYSMIYNPWWSLVFEGMEVITLHLMWVAAATYGATLAPKGLLATMQGAMGGVHYGIGRGIGSFAGGNLLKHFGARVSFRLMGTVSVITGIVYYMIYVIYIRKLHAKRKAAAQKVKELAMLSEKDIEAMGPLLEKLQISEKCLAVEFANLSDLEREIFESHIKKALESTLRIEKEASQLSIEKLPVQAVNDALPPNYEDIAEECAHSRIYWAPVLDSEDDSNDENDEKKDGEERSEKDDDDKEKEDDRECSEDADDDGKAGKVEEERSKNSDDENSAKERSENAGECKAKNVEEERSKNSDDENSAKERSENADECKAKNVEEERSKNSDDVKTKEDDNERSKNADDGSEASKRSDSSSSRKDGGECSKNTNECCEARKDDEETSERSSENNAARKNDDEPSETIDIAKKERQELSDQPNITDSSETTKDSADDSETTEDEKRISDEQIDTAKGDEERTDSILSRRGQ